jgi:hypothetical protein
MYHSVRVALRSQYHGPVILSDPEQSEGESKDPRLFFCELQLQSDFVSIQALAGAQDRPKQIEDPPSHFGCSAALHLNADGA